MNDERTDDLSERLRRARQLEAPPELWSRIAATASHSPTTSQKLGALVLGCASFVFAAKLWQIVDPHPQPASTDLERVRDVDASLALALPWFESGRLDTTLSFDLEDRPELQILREARALHSNPDHPEQSR